MTLDNIFIATFVWISVFTGWCTWMMLRRKGNEAADYEVAFFRGSVCALFALFAARLFFQWPREILVPLSLVLAYTSTRTALRVKHTIDSEDKENAVERRHREMVRAVEGHVNEPGPNHPSH